MFKVTGRSFLDIWAVFFICTVLVTPAIGQDNYEVDDEYIHASVIVVSPVNNGEYTQFHTIHKADDEDWIQFYALEGETYALLVNNVSPLMHPYIELYGMDGKSLIGEKVYPSSGSDVELQWDCPEEGVYYIKIYHATPNTYNEGETYSYNLDMYHPDAMDVPGYLTGTVKNNFNQPVFGARIKLSGSLSNGSGMSASDGSYVVGAKQGSYTVSVAADGHQGYSRSGVNVSGRLTIVLVKNNQAPEATPDYFTVERGRLVSGNVLSNDTDGDGDTLTAVLDSKASHGQLSLRSDGYFSYTHNGDSSDSDTFSYHANDGKTDSQTVKVHILIEQSINLPFMLLLL